MTITTQKKQNFQQKCYNFSSLKDKKIGIVGATGAVGAEFLKIFERINLPPENITLFASKKSAGKNIHYHENTLTIQELRYDSFKSLDIALFSAGSSISKQYREFCVSEGVILIDNSSAFRMETNTPLVIPEVNPHHLERHVGLIANPNCSTIIMLMGVFPIHKHFPIERIVVSTYQAASGAGWAAMEELKSSTESFLHGHKQRSVIFPFPYAFNLFSHDSKVDDSGYCEEEIKMIQETKKILDDSEMKIIPTCIRVPVLRAHSESIHLCFKEEAPSTQELLQCFTDFSGIIVVDDRKNNHFPMPLEASEKYECLIGRIRGKDSQSDDSAQLFISGDQLLKGAALNAVQIADLI